ncbi:MAG TPA: C40 family peptidase [Gaiellaceae bacterium]|nr:C40 family peptidase [Gaiellaceae bacterium]
MGRLAVLACAAVALVAGVGDAGAVTGAGSSSSWATPQIKTVVAAGLMAPSVGQFRPGDPLTWSDFAVVLSSLGSPVTVTSAPDRPVTMRELDARLVTAVGLRPAARQLRLAALSAGLEPTEWLGTETVARMLGLRVNHLRDQEQLELQLSQPATRAEAAYSIARVLSLQSSEIGRVEAAADSFALPSLTAWQQIVLSRALRFVGSPYVWGGTSEKPQELFGKLVPGGFDCSGFVWRVYKLEPFAHAPSLAGILKGRTTYAMSGEVVRSKRVPRARLRPADLVFFGPNGPRSKPTQVAHMGIYLGNGWIVHAYDRGVALEPMVGWLDADFAWGRDPLAEAGLS